MARTFYVGALNIKMHPHSPEAYVEALKQAFRTRVSVSYLSDRHAMIGMFNPHNLDRPMDGYEGQLLSFVDFDPSEPWIDTAKGKQANATDLEKIVIPERLKPGMKRFNFAFFPESHRLVYEAKSHEGNSLGPRSAQKAFERILNDSTLQDKYGPIDVIIEPKKEALDKILGIARLSKLKIYVTRPNADDNHDAELEFMERLERMHAQSHTEEYHARQGQGLTLDKETRTLAKIGSHNGYVEGSGRNAQNEPVYESTSEHPLRERTMVLDKQLPSEALWDKACEIVRSIRGK